MSTRLSHYCDRVIEAGWLAAAVLTPLFFNIYSSRVFEPDKLTLLRSIAVFMGLAWLIRTCERMRFGSERSQGPAPEGRPSAGDWRSFLQVPLVPWILLLIVVYLLVTALSVVPGTSFWGSYQRLQGTYTFLAYIVIFFTTWQSLRTRVQLERLLNAIVLTSLPIALYGVLQRFGLDPLPWAGSVSDRVTGNLGNAIFIAAYLIMAFFVTFERMVVRFRRLFGEGGTLADALAAGTYLFVLSLQALAIYFSQSRGPWLGLLGGIYVFALIALVALRRTVTGEGSPVAVAAKAVAFALLSLPVGVIPAYIALILARRGRRWLWLSLCIHSVMLIGFLVAFNLPQSPLAPLRQVAGIGRLGRVFETEAGTGRVRVLIWEGAVQMLKSNPARAVVGYGPESMYVAYNPFYPPDLAHYESRNASPDRSHNETFDALVTTGIIGFLVYITLFVSIFYYGLRWLGFLPSNKAEGGSTWRAVFLSLTIAGAVLGAVVPLLLDGSLRFAGVGIPAGLIAGVALYLAASAFRSPVQGEPSARFGPREQLLAGLLAMIVAHFIEIHFGIAIAATRLYFWLGLALLLAAGTGRLSLEPGPAPAAPAPRPASVALESRKHGKRRRHEGRAPVVAVEQASPRSSGATAGFLGALVLGTLFFDFVVATGKETSPFQILWSSLMSLRPSGQSGLPSPGIMAMVFLAWLLGAVLVAGEVEAHEHFPDRAWWVSALGWYLAVSAGWGLAYAFGHALQLHPDVDLGNVLRFFYGFVFCSLLLTARVMPGPRPTRSRTWEPGWAWVYALGLAATGWLVLANMNVVRADIYYKTAWEGLHRPASDSWRGGRMDRDTALRYCDQALLYYERAIACAPVEDYYRLFRGKGYLEMAEMSDASSAERYLIKSEEDLLLARRLNPLNTDHTANLARLYRTWAALSADPAAREQRMAQSLHYYVEATRLSPHNAILYNEWGRTLLDAKQPEQALAMYQRSLALDDRFSNTYMLLGEYYSLRGHREQAISYYQQAAAVEPRSVTAHSLLGQLYAETHRYTEAISANLQVLTLRPQDYGTTKNLAILYRDVRDFRRALEAATAARELAPERDRAALDQFIAEMQAALQQETSP